MDKKQYVNGEIEMITIGGSILADHRHTGLEHGRNITPFTVEIGTPWMEIVDMAIERTYPDGNFENFNELVYVMEEV